MTNTIKQPTTPATVATSTLLAAKDVKDFKITSPMVDVRGWDVMGPGDVKLGSVDRIMLDSVEKKPRYLSVTLIDRQGQHMLLPIGLATVVPTRQQVMLSALTPEILRAIPLLGADVVTVDFERLLLGAVTGKKVTALTPEQWYADPVFDLTRMFGSKAPVHKS